MTMQRLCHVHARSRFVATGVITTLCCAAQADTRDHDYPTHARVEYVQECIATHGGKLSSLYQCSCVIDRIATRLSYDEYVEASTFAKYSGLPGEGGALFRDSDHARQMAKKFRDAESEGFRACGMQP